MKSIVFRSPRTSLFALLVVSAGLSTVACGRSLKEAAPTGSTSYEMAAPAERAAHGGPVGAPAAEPARAAAPQMKEKKSADAWDEMAVADAPEMEEDARDSGFNTESYDHIVDNRFVSVKTAPLSTFSVDVDTASYSNVRRFLQDGSKPPAGAVRIEELVNYFDYDYDAPTSDQPFSVYTELSTAPWAENHKLLHIGLQGKRLQTSNLPPRNLVFLLDVSGSMNDPNKLPLLKSSLSALLDTMGEKDTVSIVVYAGASGMVLPPTSAHNRAAIQNALDRLEAGGSTNGGEGIELAYRLAERNFQKGGVNRVILATDGDFNIGTTSQSDLVKLIEKKRETGVFLTVLGFGMGNYKDSTLEKLADHGNGNYAYIDTFSEAKKVLVEEGGANMVTIAKDVKIQIEMNPAVVGAYRLIGYENRILAAEDFNDDKKDAGDIGAGHTVTALYEIVSPAEAASHAAVDPLKYQSSGAPSTGPSGTWATVTTDGNSTGGGELATVKLRYKSPQGSRSTKVEYTVMNQVRAPRDTSMAFRFSAAVAGFGMILRDSEYRGSANYSLVRGLAAGAIGEDQYGHRREFLSLVEQAARL